MLNPIIAVFVIAFFAGLLLLPGQAIARNPANNVAIAHWNLVGEVNSRRADKTPQEAWADAQHAAKFSFSFDTFLLATMASSEYNGYGASQDVKAAVMHVALNFARKNRRTLQSMLIPDGQFGDQAGRWASTMFPPRLYDLLIAQQVMNGDIPDLTDGAIQFDSPRAQDRLHDQYPNKYKTAQQIAEDRINAGRHLVTLAGEDPGFIRFWA